MLPFSAVLQTLQRILTQGQELQQEIARLKEAQGSEDPADHEKIKKVSRQSTGVYTIRQAGRLTNH